MGWLIRRELLENMTRSGLVASLFSLAVSLAAWRLLWGHAEPSRISLWLGMMSAAFLFRFLVYRGWRLHRRSHKRDTRRWEQLFGASALLEGIIWGALALSFDFGDPILSYAMATVIALAAFGGISAYGMSRIAGALFFLPIFFAQGIAFAVRPLPYGSMMLAVWTLLSVLALIAHYVGALRYRKILLDRLVQSASAAEQHTLLNTLTVGVLVIHNNVITDCNAFFLKMFGLERNQLIGAGVGELLALGARWADVIARHESVVDKSSIVRRVTLPRHDGKFIDVEVHLGLVEPANPESAIVGVYEDVTEQLSNERELRLSRERLRLALDALQSGVWDVDLKQQRHFFSRRFKSILGYPDDDGLEGSGTRLFFHHAFIDPRDMDAVADARLATLLHGEPFDAQYRVVKDGRMFWLRETALALTDDDGDAYRFTGSITDTTAVNSIQERLRASEAFHRNLIEASNALIWRTDSKGVLTFVNERGARELYGYEPGEMIGRHVDRFASADTLLPEVRALFEPLMRGEAVRNVELVHLTRRQRRIFVSVNAVPVTDESGHFTGVIGINTDITHLKKRERAFQDVTRVQRLIFDSAGEGIVMVRNHRIYRANQAFADLVGSTLGELVARPLSQFFQDPPVWDAVEEQLATLGNVIKVEQQILHSGGAPLWVSVTGRTAEMAEQDPVYIWVFADITSNKAQEEQSWHRANHDELTGLPNRRLLQDRLEQALARARRESLRVAIMMLDLDGFKGVNDEYGHQFGDEVLKHVAARLADHVRQLDTVARLGGDEFVVILHQVANELDIELMAHRIIEEISEPIEIAGRTVRIGTSIGIAPFPDCADGISGLMHAADMAMYAAKASGKGTFRVASAAPRAKRSKEGVRP